LNSTATTSSEKTKILIVDDEPEIVTSYKTILSAKGYQADGATSGKEAIRKIQGMKWDIIITDLEMGETNGLQILAEANKLDPAPVTIILTGYASLDSALKAIQFGAAGYLMKPCDVQQMEAAIHQGLAKRNFNLMMREEISTYNELALTINSSLDLKEIFSVTLSKILDVLRLDASAIHSMDEKNRKLNLVTSWGLTGDMLKEIQNLPFGTGLAGQVAQRKTVLVQEDTFTKRPSSESPKQSYLSWIGIPLKAKDRLKGVMTLYSRGGRIFKPSDLRLLDTVGTQLALAIENAELIENLTNKLKETQVLYNIEQILVKSIRLEECLPEVLRIIREGFGYLNGCILLHEPSSNLLRIHAVDGYLSRLKLPEGIPVGEGSITGMCALQRKVFNVPDVTKFPHYLKVSKDTVSEIAIPLIAGGELMGVLDLESDQPSKFSEKDVLVLNSIASQTAVVIKNAGLYRQLQQKHEELEQSFVHFMQSLGNTIEANNPYTEGHVKRASDYAVAVARRLNLPEQEIKNIVYGAALHDLGKLAVPDSILKKPGKLTEEEWAIMRTHPQKGVDIIEGVKFLEGVKPIILHHQERYDGSTKGEFPGYPTGLKWDQIPIGARIIAVVDAYDAITTTRPYRRGLPEEVAFRRLREASGSQFDPKIVEIFIEILQEEKKKSRSKKQKS
jgi:response regulator RpfG family c-di-GMP phosphodiesterase